MVLAYGDQIELLDRLNLVPSVVGFGDVFEPYCGKAPKSQSE